MKVILPNKQVIYLDHELDIDEKLKIVESLLYEWEDVIHENWLSNSVKYFLDSLSSFLVWKRQKDKYVLSKKQLELMKRADRTILLSALESASDEDSEV